MPTFCHNRTLHIHKSVLDGIQRFQSCQVLLLTPLLRELILAVDDWQLNLRQEEARYMGLALIACLKRSASLVSTWCMPRSRPLQAFCAAVLGTLDLRVSLSDWSRTLNVSPKSLTRMFVKETGLTIRKWIQLARLEHAYVLLAQGEGVTTAALACGYSSVSSFIAAFRKQFGITPGAVR